jgi:hypothetical protein
VFAHFLFTRKYSTGRALLTNARETTKAGLAELGGMLAHSLQDYQVVPGVAGRGVVQ